MATATLRWRLQQRRQLIELEVARFVDHLRVRARLRIRINAAHVVLHLHVVVVTRRVL